MEGGGRAAPSGTRQATDPPTVKALGSQPPGAVAGQEAATHAPTDRPAVRCPITPQAVHLVILSLLYEYMYMYGSLEDWLYSECVNEQHFPPRHACSP